MLSRSSRRAILPGLPRVHEIEVAHRNRNQVAGQRTSGPKDYLFHAVGLIDFGDRRSVVDGGVFHPYVKCDLPGSFEIGLIETGKGAARVGYGAPVPCGKP